MRMEGLFERRPERYKVRFGNPADARKRFRVVRDRPVDPGMTGQAMPYAFFGRRPRFGKLIGFEGDHIVGHPRTFFHY